MRNKVVLVLDRHLNDLHIKVNGRVVAFIWDVTGVEGNRIMRRGEVAGTLALYEEIQELWY